MVEIYTGLCRYMSPGLTTHNSPTCTTSSRSNRSFHLWLHQNSANRITKRPLYRRYRLSVVQHTKRRFGPQTYQIEALVPNRDGYVTHLWQLFLPDQVKLLCTEYAREFAAGFFLGSTKRFFFLSFFFFFLSYLVIFFYATHQLSGTLRPCMTTSSPVSLLEKRRE